MKSCNFSKKGSSIGATEKSENFYGEHNCAVISCSICFGNFNNPKSVKLGTLLKLQ
jgi:hypothetical protein